MKTLQVIAGFVALLGCTQCHEASAQTSPVVAQWFVDGVHAPSTTEFALPAGQRWGCEMDSVVFKTTVCRPQGTQSLATTSYSSAPDASAQMQGGPANQPLPPSYSPYAAPPTNVPPPHIALGLGCVAVWKYFTPLIGPNYWDWDEMCPYQRFGYGGFGGYNTWMYRRW